MKKFITLFVSLICLSSGIHAQVSLKLKQTIILRIPGEKGENGTNGASLTFHPLQKKYYAAMAGNASYPITVFDINGYQLSSDTLTAGFDVRGLWFNPIAKSLQANGYNNFGWTNFKLNMKGIPVGNIVFMEGRNQPGEQSVGTFDAKSQAVLFLSGNKVVAYDIKTGNSGKEYPLAVAIDSLDLDVLLEDELPYKYNNTTVVFTNMPGAEFGLLDVDNKIVELYSKTTGKLTKSLLLPADAICNTSFNFSFANGIFWLFDKDSRTWTGYKM